MINEFLSQLKTAESVAILTHVNPDGDAFGSSMMMWDFLSQNFPHIKKAIFTEYKTLSDEFKAMTKGATINPDERDFDVAIAVDCGDKNRFLKYADVFDNAKFTASFDHHKNNPNYADVNFVNIVSSNCENIFNQIFPLKMKLSQKFFKYCYVGVLTDTNNFTVPNICANTFKIVSEIMDQGVNILPIYNMFFKGNERNKYQLLARAMTKAEYWFDGKAMFVLVTHDDLNATNCKEDDCSIIINQAFALTKNCLTYFVASPRQGKLHISMRCVNGMDVSHIARMFGGGGHACASATDTTMSVEQAKEILKAETLKNFSTYTPPTSSPFD